MPEALRIGLVGCGGMMVEHVKAFAELWRRGYRDFRIAACCDPDRARAERLATDAEGFQGERPRVLTNLQAMLEEDGTVAAVDISVAHRLHHMLAVSCLEAGKHVTIEKPIAITIRAAQCMIEAARKRGLVLHVAENYRRAHGERAINWAIRTGRIGRVRMVFWMDVDERLHPWGWRDDRETAGGGWSMDGGVHFADLFRYHVGEVEEMVAYSRSFHPFRYRDGERMEQRTSATVEDTTFALLRFENGAVGQWTSTTAAPGNPFSDRAVYGESGSIRWGTGLDSRTGRLSMEELMRLHQSSISAEEREHLFPLGITSAVASVAFELHEFVEAVVRGGAVEIDGVEGMKDLALSLAIYESEAAGGPVRIKDIENGRVADYQRQFDEPLGLV